MKTNWVITVEHSEEYPFPVYYNFLGTEEEVKAESNRRRSEYRENGGESPEITYLTKEDHRTKLTDSAKAKGLRIDENEEEEATR